MKRLLTAVCVFLLGTSCWAVATKTTEYNNKATPTAQTDRLAGQMLIGNTTSQASVRISSMTSYFIDGNVGIGTTNPSWKLDVIGAVRASTYVTALNFYGDWAPTANFNMAGFKIIGSGNIGVGTSNPTSALTVIGNVSVTGGVVAATSTYALNAAGLVQTSSSTSYNVWVTSALYSLNGGSGGGSGQFMVSPSTGVISGQLADSVKLSTANISATGSSGYLNRDGTWSTPSSGGGVTISTFTYNLSSGGDVYIASGSFVPIVGCHKVVDVSTWTITGLRAYCLWTSTTGATGFMVGYSTTTDTTGVFSNLTQELTVPTNSKYSSWVTISSQAVTPSTLFLQTTNVPTSGTLPGSYGVEIRYWKDLSK
jgi:hypothetical protein